MPRNGISLLAFLKIGKQFLPEPKAMGTLQKGGEKEIRDRLGLKKSSRNSETFDAHCKTVGAWQSDSLMALWKRNILYITHTYSAKGFTPKTTEKGTFIPRYGGTAVSG